MSVRRRVLASLFLVVVHAGATQPVLAECWQPPVAGPVVDPFRAPACPWCPGNRGVEYSTRPGGLVRAVRSGTVTFSGAVADTIYVVVEHPDGVRATYGSLASTWVRRGDVVVARAIVGVSGRRVHFGLRDGRRYLDPSPRLGRPTYPVRLVPLDGTPPRSVGPPRFVCGRRWPVGTRRRFR